MYVICLEYHYVGVLALVCLFALFVLSLFRFRCFAFVSFYLAVLSLFLLLRSTKENAS